MLRSTVLALFILLMGIGGCVLTNNSRQPVSQDYIAQIHTVGLISLLPRQPNISYLESSAIESHFSSAVVEDWDPETLVLENLVSRLKRKNIVAKKLEIPTGLETLKNSNWNKPTTEDIAEQIYMLGEHSAVDMILVLRPNVEKDSVTNTNQNIRGFGIQRAFDTGAFVYASVHLETFDIRRSFSVGRSSALQSESAQEGLWKSSFLNRSDVHTIEENEIPKFREQMSRVLNEAIGIAAREIGL